MFIVKILEGVNQSIELQSFWLRGLLSKWMNYEEFIILYYSMFIKNVIFFFKFILKGSFSSYQFWIILKAYIWYTCSWISYHFPLICPDWLGVPWFQSSSCLEKIFRNILWKRKKIVFLTVLYIFHKSGGIKTFLKWFINKWLKSTH